MALALASSAVRLAKEKVPLNKEGRRIETLRVDVLCVDKTGTTAGRSGPVKDSSRLGSQPFSM